MDQGVGGDPSTQNEPGRALVVEKFLLFLFAFMAGRVHGD